jgi:cysteine desulfurase / selenocysteine lyase
VRNLVVGVDIEVPILGGGRARLVGLDNAASTPPLRAVVEAIERFLPYYAGVHRGTGLKARASTALFEWARSTIAELVHADPDRNTVIFGKNATEAINKLAHRFPWRSDAVVLTTQLEHHSNDLPFRPHAQVVHVQATRDGRLDEVDFDRQLALHGRRVQLVTVTGASNVTGLLPPIHRLARKAHRAGARILVDAAQLAAHRAIDMLPDDHPEHLDFVAMSAHKMYAPFGTGALVGAKDVFSRGEPEHRGGGTIRVVLEDDVEWADAPDRDEAGSPNVIGALAMAIAAKTLARVGFAEIAAHERELVAHAHARLGRIPGVHIYGVGDSIGADDRVGIVSFDVTALPHGLVAAVLAHEGAIAVRSGCFCAQPYVRRLLALDPTEWRRRMATLDIPGMVRASFGLHNTVADIDTLADHLTRIAARGWNGDYARDPTTGEVHPTNDDTDTRAIAELQTRLLDAMP